jgi:hypothetical protein
VRSLLEHDPLGVDPGFPPELPPEPVEPLLGDPEEEHAPAKASAATMLNVKPMLRRPIG